MSQVVEPAADASDGTATVPDVDPQRRRRWPWIVGLTVVIVAAAAVAVVLLAPDESTTDDTVAETINTAQAVRTDLIDQTEYDATLGTIEDDPLPAPQSGVVSFTPDEGEVLVAGDVLLAVDGDPVVLLDGIIPAFRDFQLGEDDLNVTSRANGTLTAVAEVGDILRQGDVIAEVDGRPIVILYGDTPAYRNLFDASTNLEGDDVLQLERALTDLGFNENEASMTVDGEFTGATADVVEEWQEAIGMDDDGIVNLGEVIFVPGPVQVVSVPATVGDRVNDGSPLLQVATGDPLEGPDVLQLEAALTALGFDADGTLTVDGSFDVATSNAIKELQAAIGADEVGFMTPTEVRFADSAVRVNEVLADIGSNVQAGAPALDLSSTDKIVVLDLPAADQGVVNVGDAVVVELPDGTDAAATVSSVSETARQGQQGTVFRIEIVLDDPSVAINYEQAPVDVTVVSDSVEDVVAVPVSALLALREGGYAIEVLNSDGSTRLIAAEPGFFADGLVEVEADIQPGDEVVVP